VIKKDSDENDLRVLQITTCIHEATQSLYTRNFAVIADRLENAARLARTLAEPKPNPPIKTAFNIRLRNVMRETEDAEK